MSYSRIAGRSNQPLELDAAFYHGGVLADPYAIRSIKIYKKSIEPHNLVDTITIVDPADTSYPYPLSRAVDANSQEIAGKYILTYAPAADSEVPNVYFDVWEYFADDPRPEDCASTDATECDLDDYASALLKCCHRFWLFPDNWLCSDDLETVNFGFEPLNQRFNSPEKRPLQVGFMPLPLYDYNRALVNPMLPYLQATITVKTRSCELLVDAEEMRIGLRSGSYRNNPYVFKWDLDTTRFLKGTYQYRITVTLPDGSTRVSPDCFFTVA